MRTIYDTDAVVILAMTRMYPNAKRSWIAYTVKQRNVLDALVNDGLIDEHYALTYKGENTLKSISKDMTPDEINDINITAMKRYQTGIDRIQSIIEKRKRI